MSTENLESQSSLEQSYNGNSEDDAATLIKNFKKKFKKICGCFIDVQTLDRFFGIPNFQGINIYEGLTANGEALLILIGVTEVDGIRRNVFNYTFAVDNGKYTEPKPIKAPVIMLAKRLPPPCPPYAPNCTTCNCP